MSKGITLEASVMSALTCHATLAALMMILMSLATEAWNKEKGSKVIRIVML